MSTRHIHLEIDVYPPLPNITTSKQDQSVVIVLIDCPLQFVPYTLPTALYPHYINSDRSLAARSSSVFWKYLDFVVYTRVVHEFRFFVEPSARWLSQKRPRVAPVTPEPTTWSALWLMPTHLLLSLALALTCGFMYCCSRSMSRSLTVDDPLPVQWSLLANMLIARTSKRCWIVNLLDVCDI